MFEIMSTMHCCGTLLSRIVPTKSIDSGSRTSLVATKVLFLRFLRNELMIMF